MRSRFARIRLRFQLWVIVQLALMVLTLAGLLWAVWVRGLPAVTAVLAAVLGGQLAALLAFVSSEHRKLERFLDALAFDDLSLQLTEEDWDQQLAQAANHIIDTVREARVESEAQASYLNALVKHVPVAILSFRPDGAVVLQNNAARHLFQVPRLTRVDDLSVYGEHLPKALRALQPGQQRLVRAMAEDRVLELKVSATQIRIAGAGGGETQMLLAVENIHSELDDREITAWRDLIRVLTHEIMNSVTPIASLAQTVDDLVGELPDAGRETREDMHDALTTIVRRSDGLLQFVEGYRRLTDLPQPKLAETPVAPLLEDTRRLCREDFGSGIDIEADVQPANLTVSVDAAMIQQVLINLARNACFAVAEVESPRLSLRARSAHGRVQVTVEDNGCGIAEEDLSQIFIPFFTTRKHGSGVGMTLARQIVSAHKGSLTVRSRPGQGTAVTLTL